MIIRNATFNYSLKMIALTATIFTIKKYREPNQGMNQLRLGHTLPLFQNA